MNETPRHTVLLGSAGTGTAFAAACALRRFWSRRVRIIAMDINPRHLVTTSLLADQFHQVPLSADAAFPAVLLEIVRQHAVDTYLPLFPEEVVLAARLRDEKQFQEAVKILVPSLAVARLCADKLALSEFLSGHGVLTPETASAGTPLTADEMFLKPRDGSGSRGARKVRRAELAEITGAAPDRWLVQEICLPPEVTVDAFVDGGAGFTRAICRERIEIKAGVSTKCRLFEDPELTCLAAKLAGALGINGSFCFQVMRHPGGWAVTDVNPRPGAATAMCAATGNDFIAATFAHCWGEDVRAFFRPLNSEQYVTRQYSEFVMGAGE